MKNIVITLLKELLLQMILSAVLVAVAALIVLRISPSAGVLKAMILVIYGVASLAGGIILGKVMEKRKFLWGAFAGALYIGIIIIVALIVKGSIEAGTIGIPAGIIVSLAAGTIGGMLS